MNTYLLIHGAWHGAWCWDKVTPILEQQGHKVIAPNLPGHGEDNTPLKEVTLKCYTDCVCEIMDSIEEPVILVGHSMGGIIISQVAEYRPEKIKSLIYISAFVLKNEEAMLPFLRQDSESLLNTNTDFKTDRNVIGVNQEEIENIFYGDCSVRDITRAKSLLKPQAFKPIRTRLAINHEDFELIPKTYIECIQDKAVTLTLQRKMHTEFKWDKVYSIDSSHSPFFSKAKELASILSK